MMNVFRLFSVVLFALSLNFACVTVINATTFTANFNDGALPPGTISYGSAFVDSSGGVGGTGVLKLTPAVNSQAGYFYLPILDPAQQVNSFMANFDVLVGGGSTVPADGFSFNFASNLPDSPAYGDVAEEGIGTGFSVCFDTYNNGVTEAPAIDIKRGGSIIDTYPIQVSQAAGNTFFSVFISMESDGTLDLSYGGSSIFSNISTGYTPITNGRFAFGARTGGYNDNHWIDNISIQTYTTVPEPATMLLLGLGLIGLAGVRRKFKK